MTRLLSTTLLLVSALVSLAQGGKFRQQDYWNAARRDARVPEDKYEHLGWFQGMGSIFSPCGRYVMNNLAEAGLQFPTKGNPTVRIKQYRDFTGKEGCYNGNGPDALPAIDGMLTQAAPLGIKVHHWVGGSMPGSWNALEAPFNGKHPHFFIYKDGLNNGHAGKLLPEGKYAAHNDEGGKNGVWDGQQLLNTVHAMTELWVFQIPDWPDDGQMVNGCNGPKDFWSCDSTVWGRYGYFNIRHLWHCCWKEKLEGELPWLSNPTPYACLNWSEDHGQTWDSLISPRTNCVGCTSVVLVQSCTTNLSRTGNVIQIRGSTDNGATWPYLVGTDTTKRAVLTSWASNKRDVRIAWVYNGNVQKGKFWCVDDIGIWSKPPRLHDISVSGIKNPSGTVSQGTPVIPSVFVWNYGSSPDVAAVTLKIGSAYTSATTVNLPPYCDTILEFPQWVAVPGTYTISCYASLGSDENRANDTAAFTLSVLANTWVKMYPIYGGGGMASGACLATVDSSQIYCATGQKNFFAQYLVQENLWKTRAPTPQLFMNGGALAYPGSGDTLYAFRGNASRNFCMYRISTNSWSVVANIPEKVGSGAALAYGGGGYIYALRGSQKTDFYRYNITLKSWETRAPVPAPAKIKEGASLVWTGGDSLYAFCGGDQTLFYRYWISQNRWDARTATPQLVDDGGALAFYPLGNKVYAFFGNRANYFYAYDPVGKTWSPRQAAPNPVKNGGCLTYCNYSLFGGLGIGKDDDFWRYSPSVGGFLGAGGSETEPLEPVLAQPAATAGVLGDRLDPGEQLTYDPTDKHTPQYSPNGLWIAYTASDSMSDGIGLYRIPAIGGMPDTLGTDSLTYETPKWTGDGTSLAAVADDGIYKVSTGMPTTRLAEGIVERPQVTGTWVMYEKWDTIDQTHDVCKVRLDGTGDTCLTSGSDEYLEPQPISDSDFVCLKLKDEVYQVCRVTAGQEVWLTSDYMQNTSLNLSSDRQWLTYEKLGESGHWQVYKMRVDGTEETCVTDSVCDCRTPIFSPDGRYIAYTKWPVDSTGSSEFSQICYKDLSSPVSEVALNSANTAREHPCWSPDCRYIIYEVTAQTGMLGPNPKKFKQLGRAMTRIKPLSGVEELGGLPRAFVLYQNRPNPFGRTTTVRYALPVPSFTELNIYDVSGRSVVRLVQSQQKPGYYSVAWKGTDMRGRSVAAGTYFYVLKSNGKIAQKRMLLVR